METVHIRDEFIKLGQAMKLGGLVQSGTDAKFLITEGNVKVNGTLEYQRGKKLRNGDTVEYNGNSIKIESDFKL